MTFYYYYIVYCYYIGLCVCFDQHNSCRDPGFHTPALSAGVMNDSILPWDSLVLGWIVELSFRKMSKIVNNRRRYDHVGGSLGKLGVGCLEGVACSRCMWTM